MPRRRKATGSEGRAKRGSKPSAGPSNHLSNGKKPKKSRQDSLMQDDQDLFFEGRDEILLDGSDHVRSKDLEDYDDEEEVFTLKGLDDSASGSDSGDAQGVNDSESDEDEDDDSTAAQTPATKPSKKVKPSPKSKTPSDEDEDGDSSEEEEERWGKNKSAYYASAAQDAESDDEDALELEEAEALRLQAKSREAFVEDDFGLGDATLLENVTSIPQKAARGPSSTKLSLFTALPAAPRDKQSVLRELERTNPEVLALAREWEDIAPLLSRLEVAIRKKHDLDPNHPSLGMYYLHQQTLLTYATVLAHYLHVRSTPLPGPSPTAPTIARVVPEKVLERLYELRNALSILEDIGFSALSQEDDDPLEAVHHGSDGEDDDSVDLDEDEMMPASDAYDDEETAAIMAEIEEERREIETLNKKRAQRFKVAAQKKDKKGGDSEKDISSSLKPVKKKKKAKKSESAKSPTSQPIVFDLIEPEFGSYSKSSSKTGQGSSGHSSLPSTSSPYDAFGESTSLGLSDLNDKSARRKSLKFHTSRIESAAKRRESARANALGGDDDIPWKDRKAERRKKEQEEALKRKDLGMGGDDLDTDAAEADAKGKGKKRAREEIDGDDDGGDQGEDGYYELVKKGKKQAKIDKQTAYDAERAANRPDYVDEDANGPRSITRAIMKNRGMTPKRAKSVRNPRVKKKIRFEQAKKKVGSKRAVFKGGLSSLPGGRYDGERSGISKVVKSVKLS